MTTRCPSATRPRRRSRLRATPESGGSSTWALGYHPRPISGRPRGDGDGRARAGEHPDGNATPMARIRQIDQVWDAPARLHARDLRKLGGFLRGGQLAAILDAQGKPYPVKAEILLGDQRDAGTGDVVLRIRVENTPAPAARYVCTRPGARRAGDQRIPVPGSDRPGPPTA